MEDNKKGKVEMLLRLNLEIDFDNVTPQNLIEYFNSIFSNSPLNKIHYISSEIELMQIVQDGENPIVIISKEKGENGTATD